MNLKTETNKKGVTLSAGVVEPTQPAVASGASKKPTRAERRKAKAQAAKGEAEQAAVEMAAPVIQPVGTDAVLEHQDPQLPEQTAPVVDADGNPLPVRRSIVPKRFKAKYKAHGGTCGDDMALELKAATTVLNADKRPSLDWPKLRAIAEANGIPTASYESLNNGQKRMNVGNKLRGLLAEGKDVTVEGRTFKAEDWIDPREARKAAATA